RLGGAGKAAHGAVVNHENVAGGVGGFESFDGECLRKVRAASVIGRGKYISCIVHSENVLQDARGMRHGSTYDQSAATVVVILLEHAGRSACGIDHTQHTDGVSCSTGCVARRGHVPAYADST